MALHISKNDEAFREYALGASPMPMIFKVCMPLAIYQALQAVFRIADALLAAHISSSAVSAISALAQITLMINAIGTGLAAGGSIKISEAYGKGDYELVRRRVATLYVLAVVMSLLVAVTLVPFAVPFLRLLRTPEDLIAAGAGYFRIEIMSLVVSFLGNVYIAIERSRGHSRRIMALNMAVLVVKLTLSVLFVYALHGDVVTIALATLISQCVILAYALWRMPKDEGAFRFSLKSVSFRGGTVLPILNVSYPITFEKGLFNAGKVVVNSMAKDYGSLTVGALGISNNIGGLTTNWQGGLTDGATALISQNRGAGKYRRTRDIYLNLLLLETAIGLAGLAIVFFALPWLADVFARSESSYDASFRDMIISIHRWEMFGYIALGVNSATDALLLGYGYSKRTMVLNVLRVFAYRIPVLWFFQRFTSLGVEAVGVTMSVSNFLVAITSLLFALPVLREIRRLQDSEEKP